MNTFFVVIAIIVSITVLILIYRFFFQDTDEFREAWRYTLTPDWLSFLWGEHVEDHVASNKLFLFHLCGIGSGVGVYILLDKLFGG